jgi:hypothetical protein
MSKAIDMPKERFTPTQALVFFLAILPACVQGIAILKYGVNVPFSDDWNQVWLFQEASQGTLSFGDLMVQNNDSRLFFPNLLNIALAFLTNWNVKYEMLVIFLLACLISFNVYQLGKVTIEGSQLKRLILFLLSNLFIFAPIQAENWLWGWQSTNYIPIACITTSFLVVAYLGLSTKTKASTCIALCMMLATISTFSFAPGMLAWILVFPVLALSGTWGDSTWKRWFVLAWGIGFALSEGLYFYGYQWDSGPRSGFSEMLLHPIQALQFPLAFLGAPYSFGLPALLSSVQGVPYAQSLYPATITGAVLLSLFVALCAYLLWSLKNSLGSLANLEGLTNSVLVHQSSIWVMIGAYSIFTGVLAMFARLSSGVEDSLALRHITLSLPFAVALIHLMPIAYSDAAREGNLSRSRLIIAAFGSSFIAILVFLNILTSVYAVRVVIPTQSLERSNGKACLLLFNVVKDYACVTEKLHPPGARHLRDWSLVDWGLVTTANNLGFLTPPLIESDEVRDIGIGTESGDPGYGVFDGSSKNDDGSYIAAGWAVSPEEEKPADAVLLTYEDADGEATVFAVADMGYERPDVAEGFRIDAYTRSGWQETFRPSAVPTKSTEITAWAFDVESQRAFKLDETHVLEKPR